jgi:hypothetical protein
MVPTLKVLASLLQLHGQGAAVQSDHQGISALLNPPTQISEQNAVVDQSSAAEAVKPTPVWFRRGFGRGPYLGGFRRGFYAPIYRRGFLRGW